MASVCKKCIYYLKANSLQYCGLGYDPTTLTECNSKEEGKNTYNIKPCSQLDYLYPIGKGVEQAPYWLLKPLYYSRKHKTYKDKKTRKVSIVCIVHTNSKAVPNVPHFKFKYTQKIYEDKKLLEITWDESIRESFLVSKKRKHRHIIK